MGLMNLFYESLDEECESIVEEWDDTIPQATDELMKLLPASVRAGSLENAGNLVRKFTEAVYHEGYKKGKQDSGESGK